MSPLDDNADIHSRLAVLEDWRSEHRAWMNEMRSIVQRIDSSFVALRLCNTPNACAGLSKEIEELAQENKNAMRRIESLERWRTFISGVIAAIGGVWLVMQVIVPWVFKAVAP